jgi:hypothetical protein
MKRLLLLVGAIVVLAGCMAPAQPQTARQPIRPSPPVLLYTLVLASPQGQGSIDLLGESPTQAYAESIVYTARGAIVVTDDVGQWRFAYTKTSLEGAAGAPVEWIVGLHAVSVIVTNTSSGPVEVDWEHSAFVDPTGRPQRVVHRGVQLNQKSAIMEPSVIVPGATLREFVFPGDRIVFSSPGRASLWNSPAVLERLAPGLGFSIVLNVKKGETTAARTFKFSTVAPGTVPAARP